MKTSFNAAALAYNKAAQIDTNPNGINRAASGGLAPTGAGQFMDTITSAVNNSVSTIKQAEATAQQSLVNQADITDVVSAVTNADLTLKTLITVRDRLVSAHQEILRMPI